MHGVEESRRSTQTVIYRTVVYVREMEYCNTASSGQLGYQTKVDPLCSETSRGTQCYNTI